jgi:hypothetical protein
VVCPLFLQVTLLLLVAVAVEFQRLVVVVLVVFKLEQHL